MSTRSSNLEKYCRKLRAYFRKTGHESDNDKYGHTLVNLWQSEDEIPLNSNFKRGENQKGTICRYHIL